MEPKIYRLHTKCGLDIYVIATSWTEAYDILASHHPDLDATEAYNESRGCEVIIGDSR